MLGTIAGRQITAHGLSLVVNFNVKRAFDKATILRTVYNFVNACLF